MRPLLIAATVLALPAVAQARPHSDTSVSDSLPSPQTIDRTGAALDRMIDGLMQIDVAPLASAIDPDRRYAGGHQTLGDLARQDDPNFDQHIHRSVGALANGMAAMTDRMRTLEPVLRRSLESVAHDVENAIRDVPSDRQDGSDYDHGN